MFTRAELAKVMGIPTATMSGRIHALVKSGRIKANDPLRMHCRVTGNMVGAVSIA
jgi:predicted transcriptional regulator